MAFYSGSKHFLIPNRVPIHHYASPDWNLGWEHSHLGAEIIHVLLFEILAWERILIRCILSLCR